ncbi:CPBP family intramembrane metalloprotease [Anaerocolumna sedimenticola]|uniref:CPBP family intramembrane metalloprotease n=1 Tax=Anaerocolumna sedimenticola TaxID=2696063 RepID=A0A6P1TT54_9FIRM|nr:CPBP family intramembrane glutamic endopeptidase [Anaerocolumna sedimenticola]QHQ63389.1 CPBP family intramembrane metalloprotease [Anaerocolumna sedimenticola]
MRKQRNAKRIIEKILVFLLLFLITLVIPRIATATALWLQSRIIYGDRYMINVLHQLFQGLLAVLTLKLLLRKPFAELGFKWGGSAQGIKYTGCFLGLWTGIVVVFYIVSLHLYPGFAQYIMSYYPPDSEYMIIALSYAGTMPGLGEEPLYRALVLLPLMKYWDGNVRIGRLELPHAVLISGLIFAIGHIGFTFIPFRLVSIDYLQVAFNFILGIWWGMIFIKTKSLLWLVIAHNGSNFIMYLIGFLTAFHINK